MSFDLLREILFAPLELRFVQFGMLAAVLTLLAGAATGFSVVVRREAYLTQGVGQAMLAGIALGALTEAPLTLSAFVGALLGVCLIGLLGRYTNASPDTTIAVVATALLAIGVTAISLRRDRAVNVPNVLFGNILGISSAELITLATTALLAWSITWRLARRYALATLSPQVAAAHGIKMRRLEVLRLVTLALTIASTVQVVGATLTVVALVLPTATAMRWTRTLGGLYAVAALFAVLAGIVGMYVSYHADLPSGPAIVLVATALYLYPPPIRVRD